MPFRFRFFSPCLLGIFAAALFSSALRAGEEKGSEPDWPRFRGPQGDGISPDVGLLKAWPKDGPRVLWKSASVGDGFSSVSLAGKHLYSMGDDKGLSWVFCLERTTGKSVWSAKVGKAGGGGGYSGTRGTPTVDGDLVFALGQFGDLVCLEAATGKERWRKNFAKDFDGRAGSWSYTESPLVDGDKLLCTPGGRKKAALVALNKSTGAVVWEADFGETAGYASMVISNAGGVHQYVQLLAGGLAGVRASDGKLLWRFRDKTGEETYFAGNTANIPNPVALGDYVFAGAGYGAGAGLLKLAGGVKEEWIYFKKELNHRRGYIVLGDHVFGARDDSPELFCAVWKTGDILWKQRPSGDVSGSVAMTYADGYLYARFGDGHVALVQASPKMYTQTGLFRIPQSSENSWAFPVVIGGKLYLREKETVWCYDVRAR